MHNCKILIDNRVSSSNGYHIEQWISLPLSEIEMNRQIRRMDEAASAITCKRAKGHSYILKYRHIPFCTQCNKSNDYGDSIKDINTLVWMVDKHKENFRRLMDENLVNVDKMSIAKVCNLLFNPDDPPTYTMRYIHIYKSICETYNKMFFHNLPMDPDFETKLDEVEQLQVHLAINLTEE